MNIIPWKNKSLDRRTDDWFEPLGRLRSEMDGLFGRFFGEGFGLSPFESGLSRTGFGPRIDLSESDSDVTVKAELPGIDPAEVDVRVEGQMLTLRGEKKQEKEEKRKDYHYVERQYGSFSRTVPLPATVDASKVEATYRDGVLTITVAKKPEAKGRKNRRPPSVGRISGAGGFGPPAPELST